MGEYLAGTDILVTKLYIFIKNGQNRQNLFFEIRIE